VGEEGGGGSEDVLGEFADFHRNLAAPLYVWDARVYIGTTMAIVRLVPCQLFRVSAPKDRSRGPYLPEDSPGAMGVRDQFAPGPCQPMVVSALGFQRPIASSGYV